jgi:hypothetical protein
VLGPFFGHEGKFFMTNKLRVSGKGDYGERFALDSRFIVGPSRAHNCVVCQINDIVSKFISI